MTDVDHRNILAGLAEVIRDHDWDRLGDFMHADAVMEYPQSGERFTGLANIRGQFENYPDLEPGGTELDEVVGGTTYGMTRMYTLVAIEGSGTRGTAVMRAHYPDGSLWWVVNMYELRGDKISRTRNFFGPQFDPPEWRVPYGDTG